MISDSYRAEIIDIIKENLTIEFSGDEYCIEHNGKFYTKSRQKIKKIITESLFNGFDNISFNVGQETSKLLKYFIGDRTTLIIQGKTDNYYILKNITNTITDIIEM